MKRFTARAKQSSKVIDTPLSDLNLKNDLQIICINRDGKIILPQGGDSIKAGDSVVVITKHKGLSDLNDILKQR